MSTLPDPEGAAIRRAVVGECLITFSRPSDVPRRTAVLMGRHVGISPIIYMDSAPPASAGGGLPAPSDPPGLWDHLAVLCDAGRALGYSGATPERLAQMLMEHPLVPGASRRLIALVPDPLSHKAAPPGDHWFLHVEPHKLEPRGVSGDGRNVVLRAGFSALTRNNRGRASSVDLWDDPLVELVGREAVDAGLDLMVIVGAVDGAVASFDRGALVARLSGELFTPTLADGAHDTAWRRSVVAHGDIVERPMDPSDLPGADELWCLTPWGDWHPVELASVELA